MKLIECSRIVRPSGNEEGKMVHVEMSNEAMNILADCAVLPFNQTGFKLPNGNWSVPLEKETYQRLYEATLPGESISDAIIRLSRAMLGKKPN